MKIVTIVVVAFAILGALDRIIGNKFGIGKEFEKGFMLLGNMTLAMIGMIVLAPYIAELLRPFSSFVAQTFGLDPSVIPASLFANDMGGAPLAKEMATDQKLGMYNALVVSAMMGVTVSFNIPFAIGVVKKEQHKDLFLGFLCGIVTIPLGCFVAGLMCKIPVLALVLNILPLVILAVAITLGLVFIPRKCIAFFSGIGVFIKALITVGLVLGIINFRFPKTIGGLDTLEEGAMVCINAAVFLCGSFPLMYIVAKLLKKPLGFLATKVGINETSAVGILSAVVTNATTFGMMDKMDKKGVVLNSAFAVSAAFTFGSHMAFTLAFDPSYILPVTVGKMVAGITAVAVAIVVYKKTIKN